MHVYLREEPVSLRMEEVDAEGLAPEGSDLVPMAFYVESNAVPSFRALLPPETIEVLHEALHAPVVLGLLAEEPEPGAEIRAMVGLAVPVGDEDDEEDEDEDEEDEGEAAAEIEAAGPSEPWRSSVGDPEAWRGAEDDDELEDDGMPRAALLAFAPLVRLARKFPDDFAEELADLLESALSGSTRPALEARVDRMLGDL